VKTAIFHAGAVALLLGAAGLLVVTVQLSFGLCPPEWEWPAGVASGVAELSDGRHVAILRAADRVQVYDQEWGFVRGWNVGARGRLTGLLVGESDVIIVSTPRAELHFAASGELLASTPVGEDSPRPRRPLLAWVPGSPWYWLVLHPVACFALVLTGLAGRLLADR
jgi:hypothetical protein